MFDKNVSITNILWSFHWTHSLWNTKGVSIDTNSLLTLSEFILHNKILQFSPKISRATDLLTVSDSLSEYCPRGIGSYWASTIFTQQTKYYSYCKRDLHVKEKWDKQKRPNARTCAELLGRLQYISRYKLKRSSGLRLSTYMDCHSVPDRTDTL